LAARDVAENNHLCFFQIERGGIGYTRHKSKVDVDISISEKLKQALEGARKEHVTLNGW
jgi:hypothetical protein